MSALLQVRSIPISEINILNRRSRSRKLHREIIDNIEAVGLKRPIKVTRRPTPSPEGHVYDLVCGQGRIEAFQELGQTEIPAIIEDVDQETAFVMSLVENVARRQHRGIDLMQEIATLRGRGHSDIEIAMTIGVTSSWVGMIGGLLERGESRLVSAVETGLIPLSLAVDIARAEQPDVQQALADAFEKGLVKGKDLGVIRRLLDQRAKSRRKHPETPFGRKNSQRKLTAEQLVKVYQQQADRHRIILKKSDFAQSRLLFVVEALRELRRDDGFLALLTTEGLGTMPKALESRLS